MTRSPSELGETDATETHIDRPPRKERKHVGTMLGRYVVLQELGHGGMSVVYVAYDPELDRRVALKVVRGEKLTEMHRARLHREAQALARLSHPNVVTVFDVGDLADDTFVAMELVDGVTLGDWLQTPRSWREVVRMMLAAGRGLAAAHAAGIVHRDIKPGNIVIGTNGIPKLVDFGLARDLGDRSHDPDHSSEDHSSGEHPPSDNSGSMRPLADLTQVGHVVGTPAYMPPEQRSRTPEADERSDQFSFCASLYEALYRQRPFVVTRQEIIDHNAAPTEADLPGGGAGRTLARPPPKDSKVPTWLARVVARGLAVDPASRYPSVDALLVDLDRDPGRTRVRIAIGVGAAVLVAGATALATSQMMPKGSAAAATCTGGTERAAAVWDEARRTAVMANAASLGVAWGPSAGEAFGRTTDAYLEEWKLQHLEACKATRVRAEQSEEALDLRMACLDRRVAELGALIDVMRDADVDALRQAGEAVLALPPVNGCEDVAALRRVAPPPPAIAERVEALDGDLARVSAFFAVGNATETIALADRVIAEARDLAYLPTLARALYWRGRAIADRDGGAEAEAAFDETFAAALGAGDDVLAADAASRIAQEELWAARLAEFHRWERVAMSLANRTGMISVELFVAQLGCMAHHYTGKVQTRVRCLRQVAARRDDAGMPSEWLVTTLGLSASEAGDLVDAIHWLERGVEMSRAENGADHPRTLEMRAYLCHGLNELGDYARSAKEAGEALETLQRVAPDDVALVDRLRLYLAEAESQLGNADHARELFELVAKSSNEELRIEAGAELASLAGQRGDTAAAVAQLEATLAATIEGFGPFDPHHPNIVASRHELANARLAAGDAKGAAADLATADAEVDPDEISPIELAELRFARARAVAALKPPDLALAEKLARDALALFRERAPDTERFTVRVQSIEKFLAELATRSQVPARR
jgi:tetratricopeptide (TPR) repeat protein/predicted Ser/Thr protein kinase